MTAKSERPSGSNSMLPVMPPHNVDRKPSSSIVDLKDVIMRQSIRTTY